MHDLLARHEGRIRAFLTRRSGPQILRRTSVEDLFQEVAASALESAHRFDFGGDAAFVAWVSTIARRAICDALPNKTTQVRVVRIKGRWSSGDGIPEGELDGKNRTPSSVVGRGEGLRELSRAIADLPKDQRLAIQLYKIEGLPLTEVAKRLKRTRGITSRVIAKAVHRLEKIVGAT